MGAFLSLIAIPSLMGAWQTFLAMPVVSAATASLGWLAWSRVGILVASNGARATAYGLALGIACGYYHGCDSDKKNEARGFTEGRGTTVQIFNGLGGWLTHSDEVAGIEIYAAYNSTANLLQGEKFVLPWQDIDTAVSYTFPHDETPTRIFITNAGSAPVCLGGVTVRDTKGDWVTLSGTQGKICGADSYESRIYTLPNRDSTTPPERCAWIDQHGRNGITTPGIGLSIIDQTTDKTAYSKVKTADDLCKPPFVTAGSSAEIELLRKQQAVRRRRDGKASENDERYNFDRFLVKSNVTLSSAVALCQDQTSKGPHFVSLAEGLFCDMVSKQLYPLCGDGVGVGQICFDVDEDELVEKTTGKREIAAAAAGVGVGEVASRGMAKGLKSLVQARTNHRDPGSKVIKTFNNVNFWEDKL